MNAKKCKRLRREARALAVGQPEVAYVTANNGPAKPGSIMADPTSARGAYRHLKRFGR